jgi:lipoprotein-anchoring transpeptidase ErfK/SrfK
MTTVTYRNMLVNMSQTPTIHIIGSKEQLIYRKADKMLTFTISTAKNGFGEKEGSFQTPRGLHRVCAKFGDDLPENAVLVGRKPTGEIYTPELAQKDLKRTWVLTRILWLEGLEPGKNQGADVDSRARYIYIHGAPDEKMAAKAGSIGCVNMNNADVIDLYELVEVGDNVLIEV